MKYMTRLCVNVEELRPHYLNDLFIKQGIRSEDSESYEMRQILETKLHDWRIVKGERPLESCIDRSRKNNLGLPSLFSIFSSPHFEDLERTAEENKLFEKCLSEFEIQSPDLLEQIASCVPGKADEQLRRHFEAYVRNADVISSGLLPIRQNGSSEENVDGSATTTGSTSSHQPQRRRMSWTEKEHELFLDGLVKYGKSWKKISDSCVKSRTPAQVSSHAQKFFLGLKKQPKGLPLSEPVTLHTSEASRVPELPDLNVPIQFAELPDLNEPVLFAGNEELPPSDPQS
ncbi:SANT/Myb domain [Dillenia turbinata]|uniref:SANT/Myb domain n=1 Tax=Dillenia turbinata TaxID=194707 RepID=A0AAN8UYJ5_9MAGN